MVGTPLPTGGSKGNVNKPGRAGTVAIITVLIWIFPWATYTANAGSHSDGGKHHRPHGKSGISIGIGIGIVPGGVSGHKKREVKPRMIEAPIVEYAPQVSTAPLRKLAKPRVPYLTELAMDIDRTLVEHASKDPIAALRFYGKVLAKAKESKDVHAEYQSLLNLGHVYYVTGQLRKSVENYGKALDKTSGSGTPEQEAVARRNLAAAFAAFSGYEDAEKLNLEALKIFADNNDHRAALMTLNNMGVLEKNLGRYQEAAATFEEALKRRDVPDSMRVLTLKNLGNLYTARGQYKEATEEYERSLEEARKIADRAGEGEVLMLTAQAFERWGRYDAAVEKTGRAIEALTRAGAPTDWAKKLMGDLYLDMGDTDRAEPYIREADYDSSLGRLFLVKADPVAARKHYEQLLKSAEKGGNPDELFTACTGLGKTFEALRRYPEAEKYYTRAMDISEEVRSALLLSERKNYFAQKVSGFSRAEPARGLVRVMFKQNKAAQSIFPSEVTKAREFADNLFQKTGGTYFGVPPQMRQKEIAANDKLAALKVGLSVIPRGLDNERHTDLTNQIRRAESEKQALVQELWKNYGDYAAVKYPKPVTLETCGIGQDEYVVSFDVLGEGVGVRLLKGRKVISASFVEWDLNDFEKQIRSFRRPLELAKLRDFQPEVAALLYDRLMADVLKKVPEGNPLTVIPDGMIALLPIEALVVGGTTNWRTGLRGDYPEGLTYVGDLHPIVYYQSLTALTLVRSLKQTTQGTGRTLVMADPVFGVTDARFRDAQPATSLAQKEERRQVVLLGAIRGDGDAQSELPRLSGTAKLAEILGKLYGPGSDVYTGLDATKSRLIETIAPDLQRYTAIVFATHGFAANSLPGIMEPVLALTMVPPGTDGLLTMSEVAGLKTDAAVVALTACQTGVGMKLAGEGVMSMGRAFQSAGARSVAMSLWSVSEDSSVLLMDAFFKGMQEGKSRLEAWTAAGAQVREAGFKHPFFWAAFVLVGEAK
jgi:CHAT domain-containing protein/Tfp pilus assembly protein PilF